jgi:hypothetical protein
MWQWHYGSLIQGVDRTMTASTSTLRQSTAARAADRHARLGGGLWLLCIVTAFGAFVAGAGPPLGPATDAAATTAKLLVNESWFRLGFCLDVISYASYLGATVFIYCVLRFVSRSLSVLGVFNGLIGVALGCAAWVGQLVPFVLLKETQYPNVFTLAQLQTMALTAHNLEIQIFGIAFVFFGSQCVLFGFLIARSTFLPWLLGVTLATAGTSYVISSLLIFLIPSFGVRLIPFIMQISFVAEGSLSLWLLLRGVNVNNGRINHTEGQVHFA